MSSVALKMRASGLTMPAPDGIFAPNPIQHRLRTGLVGREAGRRESGGGASPTPAQRPNGPGSRQPKGSGPPEADRTQNLDRFLVLSSRFCPEDLSRLGRRGSVIGAQGIAPTGRGRIRKEIPRPRRGNKGGTARRPLAPQGRGVLGSREAKEVPCRNPR